MLSLPALGLLLSATHGSPCLLPVSSTPNVVTEWSLTEILLKELEIGPIKTPERNKCLQVPPCVFPTEKRWERSRTKFPGLQQLVSNTSWSYAAKVLHKSNNILWLAHGYVFFLEILLICFMHISQILLCPRTYNKPPSKWWHYITEHSPVTAFLAVFQEPGVIWLCPFDSALVCPESIWTISVLLSPAVENRPSLSAPAWHWCGCSRGWCVFLQRCTRPYSHICLCWRCYKNTCFASPCGAEHCVTLVMKTSLSFPIYLFFPLYLSQGEQ